jgi:hypothetical protein
MTQTNKPEMKITKDLTFMEAIELRKQGKDVEWSRTDDEDGWCTIDNIVIGYYISEPNKFIFRMVEDDTDDKFIANAKIISENVHDILMEVDADCNERSSAITKINTLILKEIMKERKRIEAEQEKIVVWYQEKLYEKRNVTPMMLADKFNEISGDR